MRFFLCLCIVALGGCSIQWRRSIDKIAYSYEKQEPGLALSGYHWKRNNYHLKVGEVSSEMLYDAIVAHDRWTTEDIRDSGFIFGAHLTWQF